MDEEVKIPFDDEMYEGIKDKLKKAKLYRDSMEVQLMYYVSYLQAVEKQTEMLRDGCFPDEGVIFVEKDGNTVCGCQFVKVDEKVWDIALHTIMYED